MRIGSVKAIDGMTGRQGAAQPVDSVSKNIQNEISDVQRQKQGLSSKQEMSAEEKAKKKQELQQELGSLNTQLRRRQAEVRKEQQREVLSGEVRAVGVDAADAEKGKPDIKDTEKSKTGGEDAKKPGSINSEGAAREAVSTEIQAAEKEDKDDKDEKLKDIGMPRTEMQTIVEANSAKEQTRRREAVIARMESGIVILKGEIRQDEIRGADVEKKKAELKKQEQKVQNAASGLPTVGGPSKTTDAVARTKAGGAKEKSVIKGKSEAGVIKSSRDGVVVITQK